MSPRIATTPDQETHIATTELIDHAQVSWDEVHSTAYLVHQQFHYEYTGPIRDLRQRLVIIPPERHGDQRLVTHRLEVSSPTTAAETAVQTDIRREVDRFGNLVILLAVEHVAKAIDFTAWIVIERTRGLGLPQVAPALATSAAYREATRLTTPDDRMRAVATRLQRETPEPLALAAAICRWTYGHMRYAHDVTGVGTTASEAFALAQGVCQDYAQVMIVLCRLCGIPARYVSGHMLGEGGTHAWVEALLPDPANPATIVAHPFDPTHDRVPGMKYLTVATGRDYGDVAPTSGTYVAPHSGWLSASKQAGLTDVQYAGVS